MLGNRTSSDASDVEAFRQLIVEQHPGMEEWLDQYSTRGDAKQILESKDTYGRTMLHIAIQHATLREVEILLRHGANVDAIDRYSQYFSFFWGGGVHLVSNSGPCTSWKDRMPIVPFFIFSTTFPFHLAQRSLSEKFYYATVTLLYSTTLNFVLRSTLRALSCGKLSGYVFFF